MWATFCPAWEMLEIGPLELCKLVNTPDTKVYTMSVDQFKDKGLYDEVYGVLHQNRKEKIDAMKFPKGRYLSMGVEYLLMQATWDFRLNYQELRQVTGELGKPGFAECPYYFNLSHSGWQAMCVMSKFPVGCDVERQRKLDRGIGEKCFSEQERLLLQQCGEEDKEELFFKLWTLKESFMKCTGLGFHLALKDFSIVFDRDRIRVEQTVDDGNYHLYGHSADGYQYAWCVRK